VIVGVLELARRPSAESALDPLAEAGELLGRGGCQGTGTKPAVGGRRPACEVRRVRARGCRGSETVWSRQPLPERLKGEVRAMLTAIEAAMDGE
jgi:hypothetical protein